MQSHGFWVEHSADIALHTEPNKPIEHTCPRPKCGRTFSGKPKDVLEAYREHVYNAHSELLEDCGCCGCSHFPTFHGDCREDFERF